MVLGVETKGSGGKTIGDQVDPEQLYGDKCFGHTKSGSKEDGHNLSNVGRDEVTDELLGVVVDGATFLNSGLNGGKVVISENHVGSELGNISARAHGNTNIGLLECGSVVDTVTRHGDDFTGRLQEIDELGFVSRFSTREERSSLGSLKLFALRKSVKLAASVRFASEIFVFTKDTDLATDGFSGVLVVSSDDDDADTSFPAETDAVLDLGSRRVQHADQTKQSHVLLELVVLSGGLGGFGERRGDVVNAGKSHNAETTVTVFDNLLVEKSGDRFSQRNTLAVVAAQSVRAAVKDRLRGTLDEQPLSPAITDQDGHGLSVAGEFISGKTLSAVLVVLAGVVEELFRRCSGLG